MRCGIFLSWSSTNHCSWSWWLMRSRILLKIWIIWKKTSLYTSSKWFIWNLTTRILLSSKNRKSDSLTQRNIWWFNKFTAIIRMTSLRWRILLRYNWINCSFWTLFTWLLLPLIFDYTNSNIMPRIILLPSRKCSSIVMSNWNI